jgi:thymidylate synthase (FAD)
MRVQLIAHTTVIANVPGYVDHDDIVTNADDLAEQAGRGCYESWERPNPQTATNKGYLAHILDVGHFSILEHASATFHISEVTRAFLLELERHRHLSYSVVSQRYVDESAFAMIEHPELVKLDENLRIRIIEHDMASRDLYNDIVTDLESKGDGRKTARGAARTVLLEGTETKILVSGNMRAWRDVLSQRLSVHADREIRDVAKMILVLLKDVAPNTFQDFTIQEESCDGTGS